MDRAFELSDYHAKRERFRDENPRGALKRGIGFAAFLHGAGFTGSGEEYLASEAATRSDAPKAACACSPAAPRSARAPTPIFAQIAAETLGLGISTTVEIVQPDTAMVPNSGPTVASRTTMIVGKLVESAAQLACRNRCSTAACYGLDTTRGRICRRLRRIHRQIRLAAVLQQVRAADGSSLGRRQISGRRLWRVCLGSLRRGSFRRHAHRRSSRRRFRRACRKWAR